MGLLADQVWRTEFTTEQRDATLRPPLSAVPPHFAAARSYHIGVHPNAPPLELLHQLRAAVDLHPDGAVALCAHSLNNFTGWQMAHQVCTQPAGALHCALM